MRTADSLLSAKLASSATLDKLDQLGNNPWLSFSRLRTPVFLFPVPYFLFPPLAPTSNLLFRTFVGSFGVRKII